MKNLTKLSKKLTKNNLKTIVAGNSPDLSLNFCKPKQCETLYANCDYSSCPPLFPDPE
jgi:hypothetical protein